MPPSVENTVLLFGTFDILHQGHESLFKQARRYGDKIIAVIARDETVKKFKKHAPKYNEKQRQRNLRKTDWADKVCLGDKKDYFKLIKKIKPKIIALGYDQTFFVKELKQKAGEWKLKIKIVRLKPFRPEKFKSSKLC